MASLRIERLPRQIFALAVLFAVFACNAILGNQSTYAELGGADSGPTQCAPRACELGVCGSLDDGCGGTIDCSCGEGSVCNGSRCVCSTTACTDEQCGDVDRACGKPLRCGQTCAVANHVCRGNECACEGQPCLGRCGLQTDGCDRVIGCSECGENETCGAVEHDVCGVGGPCVPRTCEQGTKLGQSCGKISNGCGTAILDCNAPCPAGQTCGGGGVPNVCGCTPQSCQRLGAECGSVPNNCAGLPPIECGSSCPAGQSCGGGGVPNQCGCTPQTCASLGATCGTPDDGCGNPLPSCGVCPQGQVCNSNFRCAAECTPLAQNQVCEGRCGTLPDNCGGTHDCGGCANGAICTLNKCCTPSPNTCVGHCEATLDPACGVTVDCGSCKGANEACVLSLCQCMGARCDSVCCAPGERCNSLKGTCDIAGPID